MVQILTTVMRDIIPDVRVPVEVYYKPINDYGWIGGNIEIPRVKNYGPWSYDFEAKVYSTGSTCGIDDGCISKLYVKDSTTGKQVIGYDRGWYLEPCCPQEYAVLDALLEIFDTPLEWEKLKSYYDF